MMILRLGGIKWLGLIVQHSVELAGVQSDCAEAFHRITPFGTAVARAETRRLTELVRLARSAWRAAPESS